MGSNEKKTDEAKAAWLEKQRAVHLRQLTLVKLSTLTGLIAFISGCLVFDDRILMASKFAQVGLTMTVLLGMCVVWRWFVFHSQRVRRLDKSISGLRLGEGEEAEASIPPPMTVYPWMLGAAVASLGFSLLLIHKDMGTVVLCALFLGVVVAMVNALDQWQQRQNESTEADFAYAETATKDRAPKTDAAG